MCGDSPIGVAIQVGNLRSFLSYIGFCSLLLIVFIDDSRLHT